ncbi:patatin-like phospholipase family protein [Niveispirillum irakense]|uniref:patatin-like phospholipase family protein n=1 Tax=Niveispirillum irakense TaxID=34011 RepID=UPI00041C4CD5|nr:patatin-like phospholipase family protein [Niveispirillum irakense]
MTKPPTAHTPGRRAAPVTNQAEEKPGKSRINLALQGGGAHGAFTWGVLDRLLEDGRLDVEGISGTSAGAMNGALLAQGLLTGGPDKARELLERLWRRVAKSHGLGPLAPSWLMPFSTGPNLDSHPVYAGMDMMVRMLSPYQFNPMGVNPLRDVLDGLVDFDLLRRAQDVRLFVSATNVNRGQLRVFSGNELSVDCLLASACLPMLFQAVRIEGEHYWDGGYMGNPVLDPLIKQCTSPDVLVVQVTPMHRPDLPRTPTAIIDRINEISFNSTFYRELRSIELVNRLLDDGRINPDAGLRPIHLHMIESDASMGALGVSSKLNGDWGFLSELRDLGRAAAEGWLDAHHAAIGQKSSFATGPFFV